MSDDAEPVTHKRPRRIAGHDDSHVKVRVVADELPVRSEADFVASAGHDWAAVHTPHVIEQDFRHVLHLQPSGALSCVPEAVHKVALSQSVRVSVGDPADAATAHVESAASPHVESGPTHLDAVYAGGSVQDYGEMMYEAWLRVFRGETVMPLPLYLQQAAVFDAHAAAPLACMEPFLLERCSAAWRRACERVNVWMNVQPAVSAVHADAQPNLLLMTHTHADAFKLVALLPPEASAWLGARPVWMEDPHAYTRVSVWTPADGDERSATLQRRIAAALGLTLSPALSFRSAMSAFLLASPTRRVRVCVRVCEDTDVHVTFVCLTGGAGLFIPAGWWHTVYSSARTHAVNFWMRGLREAWSAHPSTLTWTARYAMADAASMRASEARRRACIRARDASADGSASPVAARLAAWADGTATADDVIAAIVASPAPDVAAYMARASTECVGALVDVLDALTSPPDRELWFRIHASTLIAARQRTERAALTALCRELLGSDADETDPAASPSLRV